MRLITYALVAVLVLLQYPLWFGNGGLLTAWQLKDQIGSQRAENAQLKDRNQGLEAEVVDLKQGLAALEERARTELGMIRKGETFYQLVESPAPSGDRRQ